MLNVHGGVRLIQRSTIMKTSCSSDILCGLGSISSVYPDSVNYEDILLIQGNLILQLVIE
jgi:hypothetical protein